MKITGKWFKELIEMYGFILLYCFMMSILINPFIILFVGKDKGTYYMKESQIETGSPAILGINVLEQNNTRLITKEQLEQKNQWANQVQWTGLTALLGWMVTSNRFKRGLNRLKNRLNASS